MKKGLILFICGFSVILSCKKDSTTPLPPEISDVNLKKGLLVYLPFDGNLADSSGNGNLTTAVGAGGLTYDEHGYANSAFGGSGTGGRLQVTNNGSIRFDTAFTLSTDVMIKNVQNQAFVTMVNNLNGKGVSFGFGMGIPGIKNVEIGISNNLATCDTASNFVNSAFDTTQLIMQPYSWYNIVTVFNKGIIQIFVNGKLSATKTALSNTVPICSDAKLIIGGWWDGDPQSLNGTIDEVRLYGRVLNADEIAQLAKNFQQQ